MSQYQKANVHEVIFRFRCYCTRHSNPFQIASVMRFAMKVAFYFLPFLAVGCSRSEVSMISSEVDKRPDEVRLQGTWKVISSIHEGEKIPQEELERSRNVVFQDSKVHYFLSGSGTYRLESSKDPKCIDFHSDPKLPAIPGIYKFHNDQLTICVVVEIESDQPIMRPTSFTTKPNSKTTVMELVRVKNQ